MHVLDELERDSLDRAPRLHHCSGMRKTPGIPAGCPYWRRDETTRQLLRIIGRQPSYRQALAMINDRLGSQAAIQMFVEQDLGKLPDDVLVQLHAL
jgi:hypothetical protein